MARRALVLAGGGARGAYQAGMLEALVGTRQLDFEILRGVSVGALHAAFLAQAPVGPGSLEALKGQVAALRALWTERIRGDGSVYRRRALGAAGLALGADSLYTVEPLRDLLRGSVSPGRIRTSGRDFAVGTVSLVTGRYEEWGPESVGLLDRILASASIPVVFPPVRRERDREVLVDGGVRNITPLSGAFRRGPDEVWVLLTSRLLRDGDRLPDSGVPAHGYERWEDDALGTRVKGTDILARTLEILTDEIHLDDIRGAIEWNEVLAAARRVEEAARGERAPKALGAALAGLRAATRKREVPLFVIAPREWYGPANDATDFDPERIARALEHGREVASDPGLWLWPPVEGSGSARG
jgi:NTE family protein